MRFVGVLAVFVGLYIAVKVGLQGGSLSLGSASASSPGGSGGGPGVGGAASGAGAVAGGPLSAGLFGVSAPFSAYGESVPGIAATDQAGLSAFGGGTLAHDYDFAKAAIAGSHVYLPGTANTRYTYLGDQTGGWGHLYGFLAPNGGVLEFAHLEGAPNFVKGQPVYGGQFVGNVGAGPYSLQFWKGPHLAVIVDQKANAFLADLQHSLGLS